jgi:hypothetical protein
MASYGKHHFIHNDCFLMLCIKSNAHEHRYLPDGLNKLSKNPMRTTHDGAEVRTDGNTTNEVA